MAFLETRDLSKHFVRRSLLGLGSARHTVAAVEGVSISLNEGEALGIAGESGSGKTTLARLVLGLMHPTRGTVTINGIDVFNGSAADRRLLKRDCRMVYQNLDAPLNPRMTIRAILEEPLQTHTRMPALERRKRVDELLALVNLPPSAGAELPFALSGGEKRRVSIARAIALPPRLLVADEPVSSLDVSIRGQIIALFRELHRLFGLTLVVISHDMEMLHLLCSKVAIMYAGRLVETTSAELSRRGAFAHPYARTLHDSILSVVVNRGERTVPPPAVLVPTNGASHLAAGCQYRGHCFHYSEVSDGARCSSETPVIRPAGDRRMVACHFPLE